MALPTNDIEFEDTRFADHYTVVVASDAVDAVAGRVLSQEDRLGAGEYGQGAGGF